MTLTTVRDAVFAFLADHGVTTCFGNPGSTELPMFRDLPADFTYVLGLQESTVVGMADGFAQATGNAALVNLHSSAGTGHALGNIFTAYRNQTPMVIVAGQQARSILPFEPFLYAERATEFPTPFVKWSVEPARAEDVPTAIARAYHVAMQAPRGPVFVSVPVDDWDRRCDPLPPSRVSTRTLADPALLAEAAALLASAERPAIVAGAGVARDGANAGVARLAERFAAPVWAAPFSARETIPEDHPRFAGFLPAAREPIVSHLAGHDLVLVLGAPAFTWHVEGFGPVVPDGAALVLIDDNPNTAARIPEGLAIVGNVAAAVEALLDATQGPDRPAAPPARESASEPPPDRLTNALLVARLAALRPAGIRIAEESPSSRGPMQRHLPLLAGDAFHTCASGGLGHTLPAAVGLGLGDPGRPVLALIGDGSSMYSIQALWTAAQLGVDLRVVIVNNGGYAALDSFGRHFNLEAVGSKVPGIDFVKLAEGQGVPAERVNDAEQLDAAIAKLFAGPGPRLLEVAVERD